MGQRLPILGLAGEDRLWIDAGGGVHVLDQSHGRALEATYRQVTGAALPDEAWFWMYRECGSIPHLPEASGGDWASTDNPGWQFIEYAKHQLGWARITINVWVSETEISVEFDDEAVTDAALTAVIAVMHHVKANAPSTVVVTDDFGNVGRDVFSALPAYRALLRDLASRGGAKGEEGTKGTIGWHLEAVAKDPHRQGL